MVEPSPDATGAWVYIFKQHTSYTPIDSGRSGYKIITNPDGSTWVNKTENWMGYLNFDNQSFHYWYDSDLWVYLGSEPDPAANGAWFYVFKR